MFNLFLILFFFAGAAAILVLIYFFVWVRLIGNVERLDPSSRFVQFLTIGNPQKFPEKAISDPEVFSPSLKTLEESLVQIKHYDLKGFNLVAGPIEIVEANYEIEHKGYQLVNQVAKFSGMQKSEETIFSPKTQKFLLELNKDPSSEWVN